jgi:hypothetical protein
MGFGGEPAIFASLSEGRVNLSTFLGRSDLAESSRSNAARGRLIVNFFFSSCFTFGCGGGTTGAGAEVGRGLRPVEGIASGKGFRFVFILSLIFKDGTGAGEERADATGLGRETVTVPGAGDCLGTEDWRLGAGELRTVGAFARVAAGFGEVLAILASFSGARENLRIFFGRPPSCLTDPSCSGAIRGRFFCWPSGFLDWISGAFGRGSCFFCGGPMENDLFDRMSFGGGLGAVGKAATAGRDTGGGAGIDTGAGTGADVGVTVGSGFGGALYFSGCLIVVLTLVRLNRSTPFANC